MQRQNSHPLMYVMRLCPILYAHLNVKYSRIPQLVLLDDEPMTLLVYVTYQSLVPALSVWTIE